jgi:hypothetical protein
MSVWQHEERWSVLPYGAPDQRTMFTPERIATEKLHGTHLIEVTDKGQALIRKSLMAWQPTQQEVSQRLGDNDVTALRSVLSNLHTKFVLARLLYIQELRYNSA